MNNTNFIQYPNPTMDFKQLSNYMCYLYPKNSSVIYSYVPTFSYNQMYLCNNLSNLRKSAGKLSGRGSGSVSLPVDIHLQKINNNSEVVSTFVKSSEKPKILNRSSVELTEEIYNNIHKSGSGELSGRGSSFVPLSEDIHPHKIDKKITKSKNQI